jgi:hypothetical protein
MGLKGGSGDGGMCISGSKRQRMHVKGDMGVHGGANGGA